MDQISVKLFGADGGAGGELRIVGLYTSGAYTQSVRSIPLLRRKVDQVIAASPHAPDSHNGKALMNVLETFPRDELFQIAVDDLRTTSEAILDLELRPRVRAFVRDDAFDRFTTALTYIPRERYTTANATAIGKLLERTFKGKLRYSQPWFTEGPLVRTHFVIEHDPGTGGDASGLEAAISDIVVDWQDRFASEAGRIFAGAERVAVVGRYRDAFSAGYRETFAPRRALEDIARMDRLSDAEPVAIDFYRESGTPPAEVRVALYRLDGPIPLSDRVPVFENLGFRVIDERSYRLKPSIDGVQRDVRLHDMVLQRPTPDADDLMLHDQRLEQCFLAISRGDCEDDLFNSLILGAGFDWRQAMLMRAYAAYMRQARSPHGPRYTAETLVAHAGVARNLLALFNARLAPGDAPVPADVRRAEADMIREQIEAALAKTSSLDEDRILRALLNLISSTLRTNFFSTDADGRPVATLGLKLDSQAIVGLPKPKPLVEIWVYAPRVEGVHLRFARIARGGLRWSDRAQDFRTEVLGLVKAQQVKNAVIVPAGAKGGFYPKRLPKGGSREAVAAEGAAAYDLFVSTLISLTDNLDGDQIVPPAGIVRQDGDDPYLVVAADKGTATFSDRANAISAAHQFWLGDAFASGGSAGYDHKKMGITARGGWESVKRHFREMNIDIQETPFRVIGVGDMSGDVFGNAMLLSPRTKLVAAFDHRDIFIDPEPDTVKSFAERMRLFQMPRSSWQDYAKALISKGGGIYSRTAKSIPLSAELQAMIGVAVAEMTPSDLMRALLMANTDLLWFGGIGTYVRASDETDDSAGDRANDAIRVTGAELRARVIGEGANLGMTQRGRIEFARRGGRLNTDFIDNSAGVNTSDQEVNIKIALLPAVEAGRLPRDAREVLLAGMTDEVGSAVLRNNYLQGLAISLSERRGAGEIPAHGRLIRELEMRIGLDRRLEFLPADPELEERARSGPGLTRPELAVLLSYSKIDLYQRLLATDIPDDPVLARELRRYFPEQLRNGFAAEIERHRLRREIIATGLANALVNRGGATMVATIAEETGLDLAAIARGFVAATTVFELDQLWSKIDALDGRMDGAAQLELYSEVENLVRHQTAWFARHADFGGGLQRVIDAYRGGVAEFARGLQSTLSVAARAALTTREQQYMSKGVPAPLAVAIASLVPIMESTDVVETALRSGKPVAAVSAVYAAVGNHFRLDELAGRGAALPLADGFDRQAVAAALGRIDALHKGLSARILGGGPAASVDGWLGDNTGAAEQLKGSLDLILDSGPMTLGKLSVAATAVGALPV